MRCHRTENKGKKGYFTTLQKPRKKKTSKAPLENSAPKKKGRCKQTNHRQKTYRREVKPKTQLCKPRGITITYINGQDQQKETNF